MRPQKNRIFHFMRNHFLDAFEHLLYPSTCLYCSHELGQTENYMCDFCFAELHYTHFEKSETSTMLDELFWGRVELRATYSLLFFEKERTSQNILHALKYGAKPQLATKMGELIGDKLSFIVSFQGLDALIPVPIHPRKKFQRGYNQSEKLAEGISNRTQVPVDSAYISKFRNTISQTKAGRFGRWENVMHNFVPTDKTKEYKHIAIVDDVITTGATIEAMVRSIRESNPGIAISVISLAMTK